VTLKHTLHMFASLFGRWIGSCAAVCVLLLFFFPLVHGPFQATHGPTTEFRAWRVLLSLIFAMMQVFPVLVAGAQMSCKPADWHGLPGFFNHEQMSGIDQLVMRC
jgi:hypothetical protein